MSDIRLKKPYKILSIKHQRYSEHYQIPSGKCLIVPTKAYGDDMACDVRWEDLNGEQQLREKLFFSKENIEPIDPMYNFELHELWVNYYRGI